MSYFRAVELAAQRKAKPASKTFSAEGDKRYAYVIPIEASGDWDWAHKDGFRWRTEYRDDNTHATYEGELFKTRGEAVKGAKADAESMWDDEYHLSIDE